MTSPGAPRWTLAVLCSIVAALCAWAAAVLPWRAATTFTLATGAVGLCHAATALLAWLGSAARARAWRLQTAVSLLYLGYLTWNVVMASASIEALYGGLGRGVAVVLALGWLLVALVLVPLSVWCLTVHGGWPRKRHGVVAVVVLGCLGWTGASRARARVTATPVIGAWTEPTRVAEGVVSALPPGSARLPESRPRRNSWVPTTGTHCVRPPAQSPITILASWQRGDPDGRIEHACVQAESLEAARADVRALFADRVTPVAFAFDVVTAVDPLERVAPIVDALLLRPGVDGVCQSVVCLAPWQLLASDAFGALRPVPAIPELRFGFDPQHLRGLMGVQAGADVAGLVRIETASFVVDAEGRPQRLRRLRRPGPAVARASLEAGRRAAEHYILAAQNDDGRFEYHRDPFRGEVSNADFSLARQAGTTLALCEVAEDRTRAREAARASLRMLMSTQRQFRGLGALFSRTAEREGRALLGDTALAVAALLACRDLVGPRFDRDIDRMSRFLLAMQRSDGGFHPWFDVRAGVPASGPEPLFAVGQAILALSLLERKGGPGSVDVVRVHAAVESAMSHVAEDSWPDFARDFFFLEENWHCLAARASLDHHRHDGYEQFCLDYMQFKTRLILDVEDGVDPDLVGGLGFGNLLSPHNADTAGFAEAMSAALTIAGRRGLTWPAEEAALRRALGFLLHHQWGELDSFATIGPRSVAGAFSEHMGSPQIRIDYVAHALAALGHGGRALALLD